MTTSAARQVQQGYPTLTVLDQHPARKVRSRSGRITSPEAKASVAAYYRARMRALWRLAKAHPVTYQRFLTEELGSEPAYRGKR